MLLEQRKRKTTHAGRSPYLLAIESKCAGMVCFKRPGCGFNGCQLQSLQWVMLVRETNLPYRHGPNIIGLCQKRSHPPELQEGNMTGSTHSQQAPGERAIARSGWKGQHHGSNGNPPWTSTGHVPLPKQRSSACLCFGNRSLEYDQAGLFDKSVQHPLRCFHDIVGGGCGEVWCSAAICARALVPLP